MPAKQSDIEDYLVNEAMGENNILSVVQVGQYPGEDRMAKLLSALSSYEVIVQGKKDMLRWDVAFALYSLAKYIQQDVSTHSEMIKQKWPKNFLEKELWEMLLSIEYIFDPTL